MAPDDVDDDDEMASGADTDSIWIEAHITKRTVGLNGGHRQDVDQRSERASAKIGAEEATALASVEWGAGPEER